MGSNEPDSHRKYSDIHIDKMQQFAVILKGSSLKVKLARCRAERDSKFRGAPVMPGYLKGAAQAES